MKKLVCYLSALLWIILSSSQFAQKASNENPKLKKDIDLFIWAGQSNAQGWQGDAEFYPIDKFGIDDSIGLHYTFINNESSDGKWIKMQPQKGRFAKGHFGPEVSFSRELKKSGYNPAIFKFSLGGTSIYKDWKAPGHGGMYDQMVSEFRNAVKVLSENGYNVNIRGFIWIQGESDAENDIMAGEYYSNLSTLIKDVRTNLAKNLSLPVVLGVDEQHSWVKARPGIVEIHKRLAREERNIIFTSMLGLPKADDTHLTPAALITHGERIYTGFNTIMKSTDALNRVSRHTDFDVLPGFKNPPAGYGEVPFYWWMGDTLTKERLLWQLDKLAGKGISSLQINYAHDDKGGLKWGLSFPSKPALFTEEWWDLFGWFMKESKKRGMSVSLSDYTLGLGQGSYVDEIIKDSPELSGGELNYESKIAKENVELNWELPENPLTVLGYQIGGNSSIPQAIIDLKDKIKDNRLIWKPEIHDWVIHCVYEKKKKISLDPMNPVSGKAYIEKFFKRFEERFPGESGKGLNFFFSDELDFHLSGYLWNKFFEQEFSKQKGYSILRLLPALFTDIGPKTAKIRLDYNDVMVQLSEEGFFKPIYDWQEQRGMVYGCDHGGRGKDVTEFGDYFRTQKWNQGPGCDQPVLLQDIIKNKVASSIAHVNERPRVWLEGFHSSGWSTSSSQLSEAIFANYMMGQNLLSLHGLYYSTHGGWWEWAPPCNHFRMPYYEHFEPFMKSVERLSYLLSQGVHKCDVAMLYPVEPMAAKTDGEASVKAAFEAGENLYNSGIDFDFIDSESISRAEIIGRELCLSGENYKALILPSMKAVRFSTLKKALDFFRAGGIVINIGALPQASDRVGSNDTLIESINKEIFGITSADTVTFGKVTISLNSGKRLRSNDLTEIKNFISKSFVRDFEIHADSSLKIVPRFMHRRIGPRDVFTVYNIPKGTTCFFRAKGKTELWDPSTGTAKPLPQEKQTEEGTLIKMPLEKTEVQIIVFNTDQTQGKDDEKYSSPVNVSSITLDDTWEFEAKPVLNNNFGDYYWPPANEMIAPEIRRTKYSDEHGSNKGFEKPGYNDSTWDTITNGYGPAFIKLGPLPDSININSVEKFFSSNSITVKDSILLNSKYYKPSLYSFSWRYGVENDPGHQGYHGLKEEMYDDFIRLGKRENQWTTTVYGKDDEGSNYFLFSNIVAPSKGLFQIQTGTIKPQNIWINGRKINSDMSKVELEAGNNTVLIHYNQPCTTFFVVKKEGDYQNRSLTGEGSLAMKWYGDNSILKFNTRTGKEKPAGWYRFKSAPGLKKLSFAAFGKVSVWIDGKECKAVKGAKRADGSFNYSVTNPKIISEAVNVALRIEQEKGMNSGMALPEPIKMTCGKGKIKTGDWSLTDGLYSYSGGVWYRKNVELDAKQCSRKVEIDLGKVACSAELLVNSKSAGIKVFPPYKFDISGLVKPGINKFEILVYNTAANHYSTIPTRYRRSLESGLIGPVKLISSY